MTRLEVLEEDERRLKKAIKNPDYMLTIDQLEDQLKKRQVSIRIHKRFMDRWEKVITK